MRFSIITVSLNAGEKLLETVRSVLRQTEQDYELLIKDGGSADGSLARLPKNEKIRIIVKKDKSIYDAMNQAVKAASGEYYIFLNCGDLFMDENVLARVRKCMEGQKADIYYGDQYLRRQKCVVVSPPVITDSVCYRNIPCHQLCFYARHLFEERGYDLRFPVRADYEHFLWCRYRKNASFMAMGFPVTAYEGGGFSEDGKNRKQARWEHKVITRKYLGRKCYKYRLLMIVTLQPLREKIMESRRLSGIYQRCKAKILGR